MCCSHGATSDGFARPYREHDRCWFAALGEAFQDQAGIEELMKQIRQGVVRGADLVAQPFASPRRLRQ